jgi:hypothetical protein
MLGTKSITVRLNDIAFVIRGRFVKTATVIEEWDDEINDPELILNALKKINKRIDIFSFVQKLPESRPKFRYKMQWDNVAAIPLKSYSYWLENQITKQARNRIKKAQKYGVIIKKIEFTDDLVRAISEIYNEVKIKQERKNKHYGLPLAKVKEANSTFLSRSDFIGAYFREELIGYIKIVYTNNYARTMGILAKEQHRDKSAMNLLIAKAVEVCCEKRIPFLTYAKYDYGKFGSESLKTFKKNNGFENILIPRYFIGLNKYGKIIIKFNLNKDMKELAPKWLAKFYYLIRKQWFKFSLKN